MLWDDKEIINPVSVKNMVTAKVVENVADHIFREIKSKMESSELPKILLHKFGTFRSVKKKLDLKFLKLITRIEDGILDLNTVSEDFIIKIKYQLESYFRIMIENNQEPSNAALKLKEKIEEYENKRI